MPVMTTPQNKQKYQIAAAEILYDIVGGGVLDASTIGQIIETKSGNTITGIDFTKTKEFSKTEITIEKSLKDYDFLEVYGCTDDYNLVYAKIDNPVGKSFCFGTQAIGGQFIFQKASAYSIEEFKIKLKPSTYTWEVANTQWNSPSGPHFGYYAGQWYPINEKGGVAIKSGTTISAMNGAADYRVPRTAIYKIVGYKLINVSMD